MLWVHLDEVESRGTDADDDDDDDVLPKFLLIPKNTTLLTIYEIMDVGAA